MPDGSPVFVAVPCSFCGTSPMWLWGARVGEPAPRPMGRKTWRGDNRRWALECTRKRCGQMRMSRHRLVLAAVAALTPPARSAADHG